jgi:hypothetical protein
MSAAPSIRGETTTHVKQPITFHVKQPIIFHVKQPITFNGRDDKLGFITAVTFSPQN